MCIACALLRTLYICPEKRDNRQADVPGVFGVNRYEAVSMLNGFGPRLSRAHVAYRETRIAPSSQQRSNQRHCGQGEDAFVGLGYCGEPALGERRLFNHRLQFGNVAVSNPRQACTFRASFHL